MKRLETPNRTILQVPPYLSPPSSHPKILNFNTIYNLIKHLPYKANMAKLSLYILLAVSLTTAAATVDAAQTEVPTKPHYVNLTPVDDLFCPFWFNFTRCWVSIAKVEGCAADLVKSITSFKVSVSAECCKAITDVSDRCFSIFGALFVPVLRSQCITIFPNAPSAETPADSAWGKEGQ